MGQKRLLIKRRLNAGVQEFRCTGPCGRWLPEAMFLRRGNSPWGIHGRCNDCRKARRTEYEKQNKDMLHASDVARLKRRREQARAAGRARGRKSKKSDASAPAFVERAQVLPFLEALVFKRNGDLGVAAREANTTARTLYAIRSAERQTVRWAVAESIAIAVDRLDDFMEQFPEPGRKGWAPLAGHRFCRRCGTSEVPHQGRGYCLLCHPVVLKQEAKYGFALPPRRERWADRHDRCIRCSSTEQKHKGHGLCATCYDRVRRKSVADWFRYHPTEGLAGESQAMSQMRSHEVAR